MRALTLLTLIVVAGCGERSTRPAECQAFVEAFNRAMPRVDAATREVSAAKGDLAQLAPAMGRLAAAYGALEKDLAGQTILDEQLRLRVERYRGIVKKSVEAATLVAQAGPETEVFRVNQAQMELADMVEKERSAVAEVNDYCRSGT